MLRWSSPDCSAQVVHRQTHGLLIRDAAVDLDVAHPSIAPEVGLLRSSVSKAVVGVPDHTRERRRQTSQSGVSMLVWKQANLSSVIMALRVAWMVNRSTNTSPRSSSRSGPADRRS